jgi:hypothetical protein
LIRYIGNASRKVTAMKHASTRAAIIVGFTVLLAILTGCDSGSGPTSQPITSESGTITSEPELPPSDDGDSTELDSAALTRAVSPAIEVEIRSNPSVDDGLAWADTLPDDVAGQIALLCHYSWQSDDALLIWRQAVDQFDLC